MTNVPYNPLDKLNLARSIEAALLAQPVLPLDAVENFRGAGVYALYFKGKFAEYGELASQNAKRFQRPIYIGKAIPKGGRKGGIVTDKSGSGFPLARRLKKHADSIRATTNMKVEEFALQYLVLDDIWIPLGENILIESFKPLWNIAIEGFGINDPGSGRLNQKRSPWDVLHPGRGYTAKLTGGGPDYEQVVGRVADHFAGRPLRKLPKALQQIVDSEEEKSSGDFE